MNLQIYVPRFNYRRSKIQRLLNNVFPSGASNIYVFYKTHYPPLFNRYNLDLVVLQTANFLVVLPNLFLQCVVYENHPEWTG